MSGFDAIDLSKLPAPKLLEELSYEQILADWKAKLIALFPEAEAVLALESEPLVKELENGAYRELVLRQRINDAARARMLAFATGSDLDHIGARFSVARKVIQEADANALPPVAEILESDENYRRRIQLSPEGYTTAGSRGAYVFHALSADPRVKDASVSSPAPGQVAVKILSNEGDGTATPELIGIVEATLSDEDVRDMTAQVLIESAAITTYRVEAVLTLFEGPDSDLVRQAALDAVAAYVDQHHRIGHDIAIAGLHAALFQPGVQNVVLIEPVADQVIDSEHAAFCTEIAVTVAGRNL